MVDIEWIGCVRELTSGDTATNITGIVNGKGMVKCPGCQWGWARVRVSNVTQVDGTGSRKINSGTVEAVEEVVGGCARKIQSC
ncbi:hypothetical protein HYV64_04860 [Candidatus Shapirobacteria bacterium]|nr:hypothetical protein [Candidatus Shapirobacteria bacterium]